MCIGLGAVIRDHHGIMCASKSPSRQGFLDLTTAEAIAALMAVQLRNELGIMRIQLEGDAKVVVDVVNSMEPDESCRGHLMVDIRSTLMTILSWEMGYAHRDGEQGGSCFSSPGDE